MSSITVSRPPAPTDPSPRRRTVTGLWRRLARADKVGVAFVLPSMVAVIGLLIYPVLSSVYYSLTDQNLLRRDHEIVWLDNFRTLITNADFWSAFGTSRSEEHTSELQSRGHLVCRLLLEKKNEVK